MIVLVDKRLQMEDIIEKKTSLKATKVQTDEAKRHLSMIFSFFDILLKNYIDILSKDKKN